MPKDFEIRFADDKGSQEFTTICRRIKDMSDTVLFRVRPASGDTLPAMCLSISSPEYFHACEIKLSTDAITCTEVVSVVVNMEELCKYVDATHGVRKLYPVLMYHNGVLRYSDTRNTVDVALEDFSHRTRTYFSLSIKDMSSSDTFCMGMDVIHLRRMIVQDAVASGSSGSTGNHNNASIMTIRITPLPDEWVQVETVTAGRNAMKIERSFKCHRRSKAIPVYDRPSKAFETLVITPVLLQYLQGLSSIDGIRIRLNERGMMVTSESITGQSSKLFIMNMSKCDTYSYV